MRLIIKPRSPVLRNSLSMRPMQRGAWFATILLASGLICLKDPVTASAQSPSSQSAQSAVQHSPRLKATHKTAKPEPAPEPPPSPPMPKWPVNESPSRASVTWDSHGLRIDASNSSLQQILSDLSRETGTKVEGMGSDQRVYGSYGPGQAREVISQLLQGSGYNVLLAGDLGSGAPRQVVLSPRRGAAGSPAMGGGTSPQDGNPDDDIPDNSEVEEQPPPPPQQPIPMQQNPNVGRPGFGPNGPIRTPQQVMEEMQRQQLLQQQQQQQQGNPPE